MDSVILKTFIRITTTILFPENIYSECVQVIVLNGPGFKMYMHIYGKKSNGYV